MSNLEDLARTIQGLQLRLGRINNERTNVSRVRANCQQQINKLRNIQAGLKNQASPGQQLSLAFHLARARLHLNSPSQITQTTEESAHRSLFCEEHKSFESTSRCGRIASGATVQFQNLTQNLEATLNQTKNAQARLEHLQEVRRRQTAAWRPGAGEPLIEKNPGIIGSPMSPGVPIFQGNRDNSPGTWVGNVVERIGETDIALVKLRKPFENKFMELDCAPKKLLHNNDIYPGDDFLIDSFVMGKQRLGCIRIAREIGRARPSNHPSLKGDPKVLPSTAIPYIKLEQGLYATNTHYIPSPPRIREGVCGSVLVRCKQIQDPTLSFNEVLAKGEVAGIMHFADLQSKYSTTNNRLCYADPFNELISRGWQVVPTSNR